MLSPANDCSTARQWRARARARDDPHVLIASDNDETTSRFLSRHVAAVSRGFRNASRTRRDGIAASRAPRLREIAAIRATNLRRAETKTSCDRRSAIVPLSSPLCRECKRSKVTRPADTSCDAPARDTAVRVRRLRSVIRRQPNSGRTRLKFRKSHGG